MDHPIALKSWIVLLLLPWNMSSSSCAWSRSSPVSPQLAHPIPGYEQGAPQALLPSPGFPTLLGLALG